MGVVPVILQIVGFIGAGYFIGKSDRRSMYNDIKLIGGLALALPVVIVIFIGAFDYNGYLFVALEFLQLTFFGMVGLAIGYLKQKWDVLKEQSEGE